MMRRAGPISEEYWGCSRTCFNQGGHTNVWGECEKAPPPPCEHPASSIVWNQVEFYVGCTDCGQEVTLQVLAESARVSISRGCMCFGDECTGVCGAGKPLGWTLDPAKVLAYVVADQEGMRRNHALMVSFHPIDWENLLKTAASAEYTPEHFVRLNAIRAVRRSLGLEGLTLQESSE